jgi:hypothetical protein
MDAYNKVIELKGVDADYAAFQKAVSYGFVSKNERKIEDLNKFIGLFQNRNIAMMHCLNWETLMFLKRKTIRRLKPTTNSLARTGTARMRQRRAAGRFTTMPTTTRRLC